MDFKLKAYTEELAMRAGRRPYFIEAVAIAEAMADCAEGQIRRYHASRPDTIAHIIGDAWDRVVEPRLSSLSPQSRQDDVRKGVGQVLVNYWVHAPVLIEVNPDLEAYKISS